jgi:hypothetical protein
MWKQAADWKLDRPILVSNNITENARVLLTHLSRDIYERYALANMNNSSITLLNLIDKSGQQGVLGRWFCGALYAAQTLLVNNQTLKLLGESVAHRHDQNLSYIAGWVFRGIVFVPFLV